MKFAIFGNTYQVKKSFHAANLFRLLKKRGTEVCVCREFYQFLISEHMEIEADQLFDGGLLLDALCSTPRSQTVILGQLPVQKLAGV